MGQNSSVPQGGQEQRAPAVQESSEEGRGTANSGSSTPRVASQEWPASAEGTSLTSGPRQLGRARDLFRHRISTPLSSIRIGRREGRASPSQGATLLESEERSLVSPEEPQRPDPPTPSHAASPIPRPHSRMSRMGARVRQRYSMISQTDDEQYEDVERDIGISSRLSNHLSERGANVLRRLSVLGHLPRSTSRSGGNTNPRTRFGPISRPIPQTDDAELNPQFGVADASRRAPTPSIAGSSRQEDPTFGSVQVRRRSRLSRVRQSISGIESLFRNSFHESNGENQMQPMSRRLTRHVGADDSDLLIPAAASQDRHTDQDEPLSRTSEATERMPIESLDALLENPPSSTPPAQSQPEQTPRVERDGRQGRRLPNLLRGRSSRQIRRDDETPLSRILQVAAAAIAAQLSGTTDALANLEAMGEDHFDGGLNAFVEELNNAAGQPASAVRDNNGHSPLNFWRVFRFANNQQVTQDEGEQEPSSSGQPGASTRRNVTVVVVGVRSVPSSSVMREGGESVGSGLDALLNLSNLPRTATSSDSRNESGLLRGAARRSGFSRRTAPGIPSSAATTRQNSSSHQRLADSSLTASTLPQEVPSSNTSESTSEPHPLPSTPPGPFNQSTVNSPRSLAEDLNAGNRSLEEVRNILRMLRVGREDRRAEPAAQNEPPQEPNGLRARRRSDSEANRHRENGMRDARRNGVVAPEGRSWLIYVVGTNLSADHPALAFPSIFSEVSPLKLILYGFVPDDSLPL